MALIVALKRGVQPPLRVSVENPRACIEAVKARSSGSTPYPPNRVSWQHKTTRGSVRPVWPPMHTVHSSYAQRRLSTTAKCCAHGISPRKQKQPSSPTIATTGSTSTCSAFHTLSRDSHTQNNRSVLFFSRPPGLPLQPTDHRTTPTLCFASPHVCR